MRFLNRKRKGSTGLVMISITAVLGFALSILFAFSTATFSSSTIHSMARVEAHKILADQKVPGSATNDAHCERFLNSLVSNQIIGSRSDVLGNCRWIVQQEGTLADGRPKMVATIYLPPILVHGNQVNFHPVKAYRE